MQKIKIDYNTKADKEYIKDCVCDVCLKPATKRVNGWGNFKTFFFCKDHNKNNL